MKPDLSVIVPTHNNLAVLRQCVDSWRTYATAAPFELVVIEDGCQDETPAYLAELSRSTWGASHVRALHEENVHEQRCTNRGLSQARGRLLLAWQDDMFLEREWFVPELLRTFDAHADLGMLGLARGLDCHPSEDAIERWEDLTDWKRLTSTIGPRPWNWLRIQEVDFVIRPWAIRREIVERVGALDPAFRLSEWDEADLAFRVRQAGWRVGTHGYERVGAYRHLGSSTLGTDLPESYKAQVLQNGRLFHTRWDDEIGRSHARPRKTWWRRAPLAAWGPTLAAATRRGLEQRQ